MNLSKNIKKQKDSFGRKMAGAVNNSIFKFFSLLFLISLVSCTDDLHLNVENPDSGDDFTGITLFIPDIDAAAEYGATRTDGYANTRAYDQAKEGDFNTLYIAAVTESHKAYIFQRNQSEGVVNDPLSDNKERLYQRYQISLPSGNYRFYVVANMNRYLLDDNGNHTSFYDKISRVSEEDQEDTIRKIILNFNAATPIEPGFIPMACLHENIRVGSSAATSDRDMMDDKGYVHIATSENVYVYADLDFLASKVRYSIIFDRDKSSFAAGDKIDINRNVHTPAPYATQIRQQTAVKEGSVDPRFIKNSSGEDATWSLYLDRYVYTGDFEIFYQENPNNTDVVKALDAMTEWTTGNWNTDYADKRAWQGVAYFPENLVSQQDQATKENMTLLEFPYRFNDVQADNPKEMVLDFTNKGNNTITGYGLQRGMKYDIYAVVKNPDESKWTVNVIPSQWSLESLAFQLHGPYELIVEKTAIEKLSMEEPAYMWFYTDVSPDEIRFESPQVSIENNPDDPSTMRDIYIGEIMKNEDGTYVKNEDGYYQLKISLNPRIPYSIMDQFNNKEGNTFGETTYQKSDISFFHIVVGSLHKRIPITDLDLEPYLTVEPQTIIVDVRELYISGSDPFEYPIHFVTNADVDRETDKTKVSLTLTDADELYEKGKGDGSVTLDFRDGDNLIEKEGGKFYLKEKEGYFYLYVTNILEGNQFWNENNEYTLTFTLTVDRGEGREPVVITRKVAIKIRPFTGVYVIHFRDNTKDWENAHIYIFQDLTLPNNMQVEDANGNLTPYEFAGGVVGYVEPHPTMGYQWNAATQYVFTNNMAFRGWGKSSIKKKDGTYGGNPYGGPDENNPWAEAKRNYSYPNPDDDPRTKKPTSTMGFVMFGEPEERFDDEQIDGQEKSNRFFWNYDYSYTKTYGLKLNEKRDQKYNFDINFNFDHEQFIDAWKCPQCYEMSPDYNDWNNQRFYTGISMEREADGWWKYTLTGVASPGRTMVIFANWHDPWNREPVDYQAEDYRYPGDYEAGLPLFDFEDNEGWLLFDGNTSNDKQRFTDNKPDGVIPHDFDSRHNSLRIYIDKPDGINIHHFELGYQRKYNGSAGRYDESQYDATEVYLDRYRGLKIYNDNYHRSNDNIEASLQSDSYGQFLPITLPTEAYGYEYIVLKIFTDATNSKTYLLPPKFFVQQGNYYKTAHPLYLQFKPEIELFVKWSDAIDLASSVYNGPDYSYYSTFNGRPKNGSNFLGIIEGSDNGKVLDVKPYEKLYGNYKSLKFKMPSTSADRVSLRLCQDINGTGTVVSKKGEQAPDRILNTNFHQILKVEDLPQFYNPSEDYYQINWHMFKMPDD